ncbi:MAG: serine/threonine protein kinase [Alphaproteobacteria bacterium]|nr:serine/threonine protein kinase [Alphaproteobacteria bacterium]
MTDPTGGRATRHRFVIGPLLGAGTFGEVYLARMTSLHGIEQDVAVKLLNPGLDPRSQPVHRMRDEGRLLGGLNHPAILHVMDFCHLDGRIGLVTEYVPGADLDACIHQADPIPVRAALQVIGTVADALHAAWESRTTDGGQLELVHRDIKPANIRVTPHGSVKLLDFGIAKSDEAGREAATQQRMAFGTPAYMAPEVLSYEVLDALPSRDMFALGATLFEALVGERFFEGLDHQSIGRLSNRASRFSAWRQDRLGALAGHDPQVIELVEQMLTYDHTQRPSARRVAEVCLGVADRLTGPSLWAWARQRTWPPAGSQKGEWSGRVVDDTQLTTAGLTSPTQARRIDPERRAGLLSTDPMIEPPEVPPLPAVPPRARVGIPADETEPEVPHQPANPTMPVLEMPMRVNPLAVAGVFAVGVLMAVALVIAGDMGLWGAEPEESVLRPVAVGSPTPDAGRGKGKRGGQGGGRDTARTAAPAGAGGPGVAWGAAGKESAMVVLEGDQDVTLHRTGRRPLTLVPWQYLQVDPGPVEVQARFPGRGGYEWQFEERLDRGETLRIRCDAQQFTCAAR